MVLKLSQCFSTGCTSHRSEQTSIFRSVETWQRSISVQTGMWGNLDYEVNSAQLFPMVPWTIPSLFVLSSLDLIWKALFEQLYWLIGFTSLSIMCTCTDFSPLIVAQSCFYQQCHVADQKPLLLEINQWDHVALWLRVWKGLNSN